MAYRPISLRWLVPALSAAILAIVVSVFGTIAYRSVRGSTLDATAERLTTVAQAFAQLSEQPAAWVRELQVAGRRPDVVEILRSNGQNVSDSARARIANLTPDTGLTLATDVRSVNGTVLFSVTNTNADSLAVAGDTSVRPVATAGRDSAEARQLATAVPRRLTRVYPDTASTSELYMSGEDVVIERAVPIHVNGRVLGHIVQVRKVSSSPIARRRLSSLIGPEAQLVVGNLDGSLWSDLEKAVVHPPPSSTPQRYVRDGRRWVSATAPVTNGPRVIGVELPEDIVLAPVEALRWRLVLMGAVIVALAVLVTERLSRRLTVPLQILTRAAEGIAAGERVPVMAQERPDEIGRLSRAFDTMAHNIRTSHDTLEHQIGERTHELQRTLTRLQQTQHELVRQERLATLGHLSGSIAHELRNPLGVMTNALYFLETVLPDAPPKAREHINKLRAQVRLSASIITGLLDFTRSGAPSVSTISVEQLVEDQLARHVLPKSITVVRDIAPNVPDVRADPVQVGQIFMNLFTNAIQAMGMDGGVLSIRARAVGERVRIEVADTGPGVHVEDHERIFEPLFTTKARGIGLGLSVSRSLARANGGDLTVVESDEGAIFALELPAASDSVDVSAPALESSTTATA